MRASFVGMVAVGVLSAAILSGCGSTSESSTGHPHPRRDQHRGVLDHPGHYDYS